jgi:hypothetical protein
LDKKITPYIYIVFFSFIASAIYGQKDNSYQLKISSVNKSENRHISLIKFNKEFTSKKSLIKIKDSIFTALKEKGFYTLVEDSLTIKNKQFVSFVTLGEKITIASLKVNSIDLLLLKSLNLKVKNKRLILAVNNLKSTLSLINTKLVSNGHTFSKVKLSNASISNSIISATLHISRSKKRTINKIIVKGYPDFPESFLKHHFNIQSYKNVNSKLLEEISRKTNQLDFIQELKTPEILFSKDSTIIYLYLNKVKANYFDGLVNFNSENKKIKFRGYFDLNLKNTFNKGEEIHVNWKNNGNEKQEFNLKSSIPYIFNTKITPSISFNIYKHDSTYINTQASMSLHYPITNNINISFIAENETSKISNSLTDIENYQKLGLGIGLAYTSFNSHKFNFEMELLHKTRKTEETTSLYQLNINTSSIFSFSKKINFLLKNALKLTSNQTTLNNELFRSGGTNSIRGFQENTILSNSYTYVNSELRLNTKTDSYIYSIHDIGIFNIDSQNEILKSIGFGYHFTRGNSKIDINGTFNDLFGREYLANSIISIKIVTLF